MTTDERDPQDGENQAADEESLADSEAILSDFDKSVDPTPLSDTEPDVTSLDEADRESEEPSSDNE